MGTHEIIIFIKKDDKKKHLQLQKVFERLYNIPTNQSESLFIEKIGQKYRSIYVENKIFYFDIQPLRNLDSFFKRYGNYAKKKGMEYDGLNIEIFNNTSKHDELCELITKIGIDAIGMTDLAYREDYLDYGYFKNIETYCILRLFLYPDIAERIHFEKTDIFVPDEKKLNRAVEGKLMKYGKMFGSSIKKIGEGIEIKIIENHSQLIMEGKEVFDLRKKILYELEEEKIILFKPQ